VGVFDSDGNLRGINTAMPVPVFLGNGFVFNILVYSNSGGEDMTVQYYSATDDAVYQLSGTTFYTDGLSAADVGSDPGDGSTYTFFTDNISGDAATSVGYSFSSDGEGGGGSDVGDVISTGYPSASCPALYALASAQEG
jgi:hypothetical protein